MDMQTAKTMIEEFNDALDDMTSAADFDALREEFDEYDEEFKDLLTRTVKDMSGTWESIRDQFKRATSFVKALADLDETITRGERGEFER